MLGSTLTELRFLPGRGPAAGGPPGVLLSETGATGSDANRNAEIVNRTAVAGGTSTHQVRTPAPVS